MLYNLDDLWEITDNDREMVISMVVQFITDAATSLANIRNAVEIEDFSSLKFNAHRIKPALNNLKIYDLKEVITGIEHKAESNVFDNDLLQFVEKLNRVVNQVIAQLKSEFNL